MRLAVGAGVEIKMDGNYVIDFIGDAQIANKAPQVTTIDPLARGAGGLHLNYNSAEDHFLGEGWIVLQNKIICAKGNFAVDMKPDYWMVQVGRREAPIMITPFCAGWGAMGWLGVDPTTVNIGLGVSYSINGCVSIDIKVVEVGICLDAGLAAGVQAKAQYKPDFKLLEAGIWAEVWAKIIAYYKTKLKSGSIELVDIYCSGDLIMRFDPSPTTVSGRIRGHISVLCFGIDFDAGIEKRL
jgi:hypothetical protein